ncbi:phosphoglycolate phosphatase [Pigmentiphaga soli]|uniref:Phosphoglycolate phosphatase n=1 Tax=Pigmentiphaga soli TaxID=1007095 RepID=A0ABP8HRX7_9BURK
MGLSQAAVVQARPSGRWRAALLDLDGTLLDSVPDLAHAANAMRVEFGLPPLRDDVIATFVGRGIENLVRRALAGSLDPQEPAVADAADRSAAPATGAQAAAGRFDRALAAFRRAYHLVNGEKARIFEGVPEGLRAMRELGLKLAVVTNKPEAFTLPLLERTGLRAYFDAVVSGDTCARKKPDPMPVLRACELLGVAPAEAVMVGDSMHDAAAGRAAGCPVLLVPYAYNEGRDVRMIEADGIVATLQDVARWIAAPAKN